MGRTHRALLKLLTDKGFSDVRVRAQTGHWRSSPYADVVRWEGFAVCDGIHVAIYSWDTMTACVRYGIVVSDRNKGTAGNGYEISAATSRQAR